MIKIQKKRILVSAILIMIISSFLIVNEDNWGKEVNIKSEEHLKIPLLTYADVPPIFLHKKINYFYEEINCTIDYYNCDNFTTQTESQEVFDNCIEQEKGDIHFLDLDNDSIPCEELIFKIENPNLQEIYLNPEKIEFSLPSKYNYSFIKLTQPNNNTENLNFTNNNIAIEKSKITQAGKYSLKINTTENNTHFFINQFNFSIISASLIINTTKANIGETIKIGITINSPENNILFYDLDYDDGSSGKTEIIYNNLITKTISYSYSIKGDFVPISTFFLNNNKNFTITNQTIKIISNKDAISPEIEQIYPLNNEIINKASINFSYKANDSIKLDNCTYELYKYEGSIGYEEYTTTKKPIENNELIEIQMIDFNEGNYSWYIICYDNSSNELTKKRDFKIDFLNNSTNQTKLQNVSHDKEEEINELTKYLEDFLIKMNSLSLEELDALNDLGITSNLKYYQKRLIQINQDLGNNIKFITDSQLREKRKQESLNELETIKKDIPQNIKIIDSNEFVKNSITNSLTEIIQKYLNSKNEEFTKKEIKKITESNYNLQKKMTISTKIKQIEIDYLNSTKKITLITKEIKLKDRQTEIILEVFPENFKNQIEFITKNENLNNNLYEIDVKNLENDKIIYYIEELIDENLIKDTETILFEELQTQPIGITGFFLLDLNEKKNIYYLFGLLFIIIFLIYFISKIYKNYKIKEWKKEENVVKCFKFIKESKKALERKDFSTAKEKYHKLKEIYPLISKDCQKYLYETIQKIRIKIDKKEISQLIKEYEEAKSSNRKEDSIIIYKNIQKIYTNLPKKYQEKVYNKIFKEDLDF